MSAAAMRRWECVRELGVWRFTLIYGVMAFGMSMTVSLLLALEWIAAATSVTLPPDPHRITKFALLGVVGGACFGLLFWKNSQRRFERCALASRSL